MSALLNEPARPVTELRPDCPPTPAAAVMRMLEKAPARRWPTMDDVVAVCGRPSLRHDDPIRREMITLAKSGSQHVVPKTPTSPIAMSRVPTHAPIPRRRWIWPAIAATTAMLALGLWWASPWSPRSRTAAQPSVTVRAPVIVVRSDSSPAVSRPAPPQAVPAAPTASRPPLTVGRLAGEPAARATAQRDDSLIGSLRTSALTAQQRAVAAGATPGDLSKGSAIFASAES